MPPLHSLPLGANESASDLSRIAPASATSRIAREATRPTLAKVPLYQMRVQPEPQNGKASRQAAKDRIESSMKIDESFLQTDRRALRDIEPKAPGQRFFRADDYTSKIRRRKPPEQAHPASAIAVLARKWQNGEFHTGRNPSR
jgi:hypothetical protein